MISTSTFMALKLLAICGLLYYIWRQSKALERSVEEDRRRRAERQADEG